ncbi:alkaline phosphatase D family protein [Aerosakkonema funiforme]|uniref:alkaline phosphatase D family protein n=1 Tax=Aerosakkonema funiforme TaxID=1246630 RepID=UPI0035BA6240
MQSKPSQQLTRRQFLLNTALTAGGIVAANTLSKSGLAQASGIVTSEKMRPQIPYGVASGDISGNSAVIWSKCDRPARMIVEYSTNESFRNAQRIVGSAALENTDYTAQLYLADLPTNQQIFYRVLFEDLAYPNTYSAAVPGTFRTPTTGNRDIFFAWSGCSVGQGWGINPDWGGIKIYETIRKLNPDFFIHCGDNVYSDNPILSEVKLDNGKIWKNITTAEKSKVAETLAEFRGNYVYNLLDENVRRFNAQVPLLVQWDDHETRNNWYPGQMLNEDDRYQLVKSCNLLSARAKRAFFEYMPIRFDPNDPERIYRSFNYGSHLDIFMLDERSYRGPNTANRQQVASAEAAFLGSTQVRWLKNQLLASKATWKVIASDMPIGIIVRDGKTAFENFANGDGPALGRELEIADLLRFIKQNHIKNIVWLTSDLHYCVASYYDPSKAQFADFKPFWEFAAGPLHGGTYGPQPIDNTFGPQVKYESAPAGMKQNLPPLEGLLFFGTVKIDSGTQRMTVAFIDVEGKTVYRVELQPESD